MEVGYIFIPIKHQQLLIITTLFIQYICVRMGVSLASVGSQISCSSSHKRWIKKINIVLYIVDSITAINLLKETNCAGCFWIKLDGTDVK